MYEVLDHKLVMVVPLSYLDLDTAFEVVALLVETLEAKTFVASY
jgi:hypothetical protein